MLARPERIVNAADQMLHAAIRRGPTCPLMAYVLERFGQGNPIAIRSQLRTMLYYHWCVRRAINSYTRELPIYPWLQAVVDRRLHDLLHKIASGDEKRGDLMLAELHRFFEAFDAAMEDKTAEYSWVTELGWIVVGFISDGQPDPDERRQLVCVSAAPARTLTEIHRKAASILNEILGLNIQLATSD